MSSTVQRLAANRANGMLSTGPVTATGKATVSRNAIRHGLLSTKLFLDDEDPVAFHQLVDELAASLNPVGTLEASLIERIAVTLWRQRRLVQAETASLWLSHQPDQIAKGVSAELGRRYANEVKQDELAPFDADQERWCRDVIAEIEAADEIDIRTLEQRAPLTFAQLGTDAENEDLATFTAAHDGGLTGYVGELLLWCRKRLSEAEIRPHLLALAAQVRSKRLVLPADVLELFARYQTTLDNQLFKLLRALRDAQEWRLKTLEPSGDRTNAAEAEVVTAAA